MKREGLDFFSIMAIALISAIIGGILTSIILPPIVVGRFENELENSVKDNNDSELERQLEEQQGWGEVDPEDYQDTPIARAAKEVMPAVVGITNRAMGFGQTIDRGTGSGVII